MNFIILKLDGWSNCFHPRIALFREREAYGFLWGGKKKAFINVSHR